MLSEIRGGYRLHYHYLRLDLNHRSPLLEMTRALPPEKSRQDYLETSFRHRIDFRHRSQGFTYVPIGSFPMRQRLVMLGRIGRQIKAVENAPPEDEFAELKRDSWRAANFLIDISNHSDGQKIAFQKHYQVGSPYAISKSLVAHLNSEVSESPWHITVNRITEERTFWEAVDHYADEITHVEFLLDSPNILGLGESIRAGLEDARDKHNATSVTAALHNPEGGLRIDPENVGDAVKYISAGGGRSKLKSRTGTVYNSETERMGREIVVEDDPPLRRKDPSSWSRLIRNIFRNL